MKRFAVTLAVLTFATPSFAQSYCSCDGTGNVLKFTNNPITYQNKAPAITGRGGLSALAMAPGHRNRPSTADNREGGGSPGYNQMLRNF
jgi:hypothetical protein